MEIFLNILLLILGLTLLIGGANFFVNGASAVAKRLRVPAIIIGLTIVAIGTSLPELAISVTAAIKGNIDISIGNIIGSNMFNMLVIIGITACISPIIVKSSSKKFDFPVMIAATFLLVIFSFDSILDSAGVNVITRTESIVLLLIFVFYIFTNVKSAKKEREFSLQKQPQKEERPTKGLKVWVIIIYLVFGLAAVVFGGECVSTSAQYLAAKAGMSEALIGITIVAFGTSLPELATSIIAAKKGENDLALGNILGSNVLNIVLIVGSVGAITNIPVSSTIFIDLIILLVSTIIFSLLAFRKNRYGRLEGIILILMYVLYLTYAILKNYLF